MNIHRWSREWFKTHYGRDIYSNTDNRFFPVIDRYLRGESGLVLDAACGFGNPYLKELRLERTVGIDIDPSVRDRNTLHKEFIIEDLHRFHTDRRFARIISVYTWEHLHSPEVVLKNFSDVLEDRGVVIIIAPQGWHYVAIVARLLPSRVQNLCWRILKKRSHMPYPVFFKLCSRKALRKAADRTGFRMEHFSSIEGPPLWFARIPPSVSECLRQCLAVN